MIFVSGSVAYDTVLDFAGRFADHFLTGKLDHLNLTFQADAMRRSRGGCAGNIAYSLSLLGEKPLLVSAVGQDGGEYLAALEALGITTRCIARHADAFTAQCFATTDADGNQLSTFHLGAMARNHEAPFPEGEAIDLAIVAPDSRESMPLRCRELAARDIPFVLDLGQATPLFTPDRIVEMLRLATWAVASRYEADLISRAARRPIDAIARSLKAFIVTNGDAETVIHHDGATDIVPAVPSRAVDPVGAGDAFRGGLLSGLRRGLSLKPCVELASVMGHFKVEHEGAQGYVVTQRDIADCCEAAYGWRPD